MEAEGLKFFRELLETPGPSGYEEQVQEVVRRWAGQWADEVRTDSHGNVIAVRNPGGGPRLLLDGHCDQIGFVVSHVDGDGYLYTQPIGGWDPQIVLGQRVVVQGRGGPVPGVIARKPKHLLTADELKKVPELHELWIDIGAANRDDALTAVAIGDPVTVALGMRELRHGLVSGAKMDNTTGLWAVFDALRRLHGKKLAAEVHFVSAVQEEIGLRGAATAAHGVAPAAGIAVDVTHATDCPTIDKRTQGDIRVGGGPVLFRGPNVNPVMHRLLLETAERKKLPVQHAANGRGMSNDTNAMQLAGNGVATACLGLPLRYMHSPVEVVALADLDGCAELMAGFLLALPADADFTPRLAGVGQKAKPGRPGGRPGRG